MDELDELFDDLVGDELLPCPKCDGQGVVIVDSPTCHDSEATCEACGGSGLLDPPDLFTMEDES
jgi:hypothetical protein